MRALRLSVLPALPALSEVEGSTVEGSNVEGLLEHYVGYLICTAWAFAHALIPIVLS